MRGLNDLYHTIDRINDHYPTKSVWLDQPAGPAQLLFCMLTMRFLLTHAHTHTHTHSVSGAWFRCIEQDMCCTRFYRITLITIMLVLNLHKWSIVILFHAASLVSRPSHTINFCNLENHGRAQIGYKAATFVQCCRQPCTYNSYSLDLFPIRNCYHAMMNAIYLHRKIQAACKPLHCPVYWSHHHRQCPTCCYGRLLLDLHTGWHHQPNEHLLQCNFDLSINLKLMNLITNQSLYLHCTELRKPASMTTTTTVQLQLRYAIASYFTLKVTTLYRACL